jgi:hypothetical protein
VRIQNSVSSSILVIVVADVCVVLLIYDKLKSIMFVVAVCRILNDELS